VLILVALFSLLTVGEISANRTSQEGLQTRFENRLATAANFLTDYVTSELHHEQTLARDRLSGASVTQAQFESFAQDFQFGPSLLLDAKGRVLDVIPASPSLIGVDIAPKYSHLMIALSGRDNVSQVVPSAVQHLPVVAFAVPFTTPQGRRVMSGTLKIASSPLGYFLQSIHSIAASEIYLADDSNRVIASAPRSSSAAALTAELTTLRANSHSISDGNFNADVAIPGTPWKILATLPTSALYLPLDGAARVIPWLILLGFALVALALGVIVLRSWERKVLQVGEAGVDALTHLANRRQFDDRTAVLFSASRRHKFELAVLMIDIDHFKTVNDRFGHQMGDRVLQAVAECVRQNLRTEDVGARWGGEEFAIVLPYTSLSGATFYAERLRGAVAATAIDVGAAAPISVTVSIGVAAEIEGVDPGELLPLADLALFRAKDAGRNRVEPFIVPVAPLAI
jgi:diguanylate cyclase (GGDEF)-like protein